jgi:hypothetical protein
MQAAVAPALPRTQTQPRAPPPPRPAAPTPTQAAPPKSGGGFLGFFNTQKRNKHKRALTEPEPQIVRPLSPPPPPASAPAPTRRPVKENLARYLRPDGTLGRAFVSFKEISQRCDTRLFETSYSLVGQVTGEDGELTTRSIGDIILQIFRLPPLPGVKPDDLPQSLEECHRGLRHIAWHKVMYHEGVLTQNGGDCSVSSLHFSYVLGSNFITLKRLGDDGILE